MLLSNVLATACRQAQRLPLLRQVRKSGWMATRRNNSIAELAQAAQK